MTYFVSQLDADGEAEAFESFDAALRAAERLLGKTPAVWKAVTRDGRLQTMEAGPVLIESERHHNEASDLPRFPA